MNPDKVSSGETQSTPYRARAVKGWQVTGVKHEQQANAAGNSVTAGETAPNGVPA